MFISEISPARLHGGLDPPVVPASMVLAIFGSVDSTGYQQCVSEGGLLGQPADMHKLVHAWAQERTLEEERQRWNVAGLELLAESLTRHQTDLGFNE